MIPLTLKCCLDEEAIKVVLRFFVFWQKMHYMQKNAKVRGWWFSLVEAAKLGLDLTEWSLYVICFRSLIHVVNWFSVNALICIFAKWKNVEHGGCTLHVFGPQDRLLADCMFAVFVVHVLLYWFCSNESQLPILSILHFDSRWWENGSMMMV